MENKERIPLRIVLVDNTGADRLLQEVPEAKGRQSSVAVKRSKLGNVARDVAGKLDRAITLGVASAYPIVFNMPTPDPVPDWKHVVKVSWKLVKTTLAETVRILTDEEWKP